MEDFLKLNNLLGDEEKLVYETVQRFVHDRYLPLIKNAYESAQFPQQLIPEIAQLGLFGMTLPSEFAGANASYVAYGLACEALEYGDSGLRSFVSVQSSLCMYPIFRFGTLYQKQHYLPAMAQGKILGCFALTEPDSGSDPASMKTKASKVKGGWELTGTKMWITNGTLAHIAVVWAKTVDGIRGFIVDSKAKGFTTKAVKHKMSLRASETAELHLQNVFVPDDHLLPGTCKGLAAALACLSQARYGIAWGAIGAAKSCYDCVVAYTRERKQFSRALAATQLIQSHLANMFTEIVKAQCLNLRLGQLMDAGEAHFVQISLAKRNACREALTIARQARNLMGANGISLEYPVIRHMMNLETVFTYEGTDNIHTLILGKHITGFDAF